MNASERLTRAGAWRRHHSSKEGVRWAFEPDARFCVASREGGFCPCAAAREVAPLAGDANALLTCGVAPRAQTEPACATGELSISRRGLTLLAAAAYGSPLALLLCGAAVGQALGGDGLAAVLGIAAALPGFMLFRWRGGALLARLEMSWRESCGASGEGVEIHSAQSTREFWTK